MSNTVFLQSIAGALAGTFIEKRLLAGPLAFLEESSSIGGLPRGFGLTCSVVSVTCMWLLAHSMSIGKARNKYMELAKKDGEKDVEERYALPNLYAQGTSKHVKAFNCAQRSHQQVLETFPFFLVTAMISALSFPIFSAIVSGLFLGSRVVWVAGYLGSEGDPSKRYSHPFSGFFWRALLMLFIASNLTAINLLMGESPLFW